MIVRLTHHQQRSVRHRVPELHAAAMVEHRRAHGRTQHDVELPPIAWRQILDVMREQCFGPMGGKLDRGVPGSAYSAIKRIAEAVMRIENHPALHERAVEGWVGDILIVWEHTGGPTISPYPQNDHGQFHPWWMIPNHIIVHDRECTVWTRHDSPLHPGVPGSRSLRAAWHLEFYDWALSRSRASDEPASRP